MPVIDTDALTLTSDQARAARNYFGLSQSSAAEESDLPLHKLKRFEAHRAGQFGSYLPDASFLQALRSFYEQKGYVFDDTPEPGAKSKESGLVFPSGVVGGDNESQAGATAGRPSKATFHHMRIALGEPDMGHVLDLIEENEERAAKLLAEPVKSGFIDRFSDKSEARHAEVLRLLADNGMLYAKLFGRYIGGKPDEEALAGQAPIKTHADLLHRVHADTYLAATGDQAAKDRRKNKPSADTITSAIFG
jgi:hypothetical protein